MSNWVSQDDFDSALEEVLDGLSGAQLLAIPGLYEIVSEHFNNEVIEMCEAEEESSESDESSDEDETP